MSKIIPANGAIVSPNGPDIVITVTLDTKTNKTTLSCNQPNVNRLVISGVLQQHALALTNVVISDGIKAEQTFKSQGSKE